MNTLESYNFHLPESLIAQQGAEPRDSSRLMVLHRQSGQTEHRVFRDITEYLKPGDVLVLNQSKVIPARLFASNPQGTAIEVLLVREVSPVYSDAEVAKAGSGGVWEALLKPAKRAKGTLRFSDGLEAQVVDTQEDGTRVLRFSDNVWNHLEALGQTPLPPYIHESVDPNRYQTIYAQNPGSVAAPTAGLHFTPKLMRHIQGMGVEVAYVTLHVGPGTFKPVHDDPDKHIMHTEAYEIPPETARTIARAKTEGRRVVAVGTTVIRTLESAYGPPRKQHLESDYQLPRKHRLESDYQLPHKHRLESASSPEQDWLEANQPIQAETQIFIRPGFEFKAVDALITNFHLPKSTLLMLVSAFAGYELTMQAYKTAVEDGYRFYSLGDAMLII